MTSNASVFATHARTIPDIAVSASDWHAEFEEWLISTPTKSGMRSASSTKSYLYDVGKYIRYFEQANPQTQFDPSHLYSVDLEGYFDAMREEWMPKTQRRHKASLKMLVNFANHVGYIDYNPLTMVFPDDEVSKSPRDLSDDERKQLEDKFASGEASPLGMRDSIIFFLLSEAGLRIQEVVDLTWKSVDFENGKLVNVIGKGKKQRDVVIGQHLLSKLRLWRELGLEHVMDTVVIKKNGMPLSTDQARKRFYSIVHDELGLMDIKPHSLRHTFVGGSMAAFIDGDAGQISKAIDMACQQTGDSVAVILKYYTRAKQSEIRGAMDRLYQQSQTENVRLDAEQKGIIKSALECALNNAQDDDAAQKILSVMGVV